MKQVAIQIPIGPVKLAADVALPDSALGLVLFAHGSGGSRRSLSNCYVAEVLNQGAFATVLADLLTEEEDVIGHQTAGLRFDIALLGRRLTAIVDWITQETNLKTLGLGIFGANTGAAAAIVTAAERPNVIQALVSRGGRPDVAQASLRKVLAPSLFIVGCNDVDVLRLNYAAMVQLPKGTERKLETISGAGHLFEERGALDRVAVLAREWFQRHLSWEPRHRELGRHAA